MTSVWTARRGVAVSVLVIAGACGGRARGSETSAGSGGHSSVYEAKGSGGQEPRGAGGTMTMGSGGAEPTCVEFQSADCADWALEFVVRQPWPVERECSTQTFPYPSGMKNDCSPEPDGPIGSNLFLDDASVFCLIDFSMASWTPCHGNDTSVEYRVELTDQLLTVWFRTEVQAQYISADLDSVDAFYGEPVYLTSCSDGLGGGGMGGDDAALSCASLELENILR